MGTYSALKRVYGKYIHAYRPDLLLPCVYGAVLCYYGGYFPTLIAVIEAYSLVQGNAPLPPPSSSLHDNDGDGDDGDGEGRGVVVAGGGGGGGRVLTMESVARKTDELLTLLEAEEEEEEKEERERKRGCKAGRGRGALSLIGRNGVDYEYFSAAINELTTVCTVHCTLYVLYVLYNTVTMHTPVDGIV